jgi:hypothetical protein
VRFTRRIALCIAKFILKIWLEVVHLPNIHLARELEYIPLFCPTGSMFSRERSHLSSSSVGADPMEEEPKSQPRNRSMNLTYLHFELSKSTLYTK